MDAQNMQNTHLSTPPNLVFAQTNNQEQAGGEV